MNLKTNFTWAAFSPLVGGNPIGTEYAFGKPPEYSMNIPGYWANDSLYHNYMNNTRHIDVPHYIVGEDDNEKMKPVDVVIATCICAGLSMLVTANVSTNKRGADAEQNNHMYDSTHFVLNTIKPQVLMGENAPLLFTNKGRKVADKLKDIAFQYGYSFLLYKTSTHLHGIPQARHRTFYFMFKSETVPILEWYDLPKDTFAEYLNKMPKNLSYSDLIINPGLLSEFRYSYVNEMTNGNARAEISKSRVTAQQWIDDNGKLDDFIQWCKINRSEKEYNKAVYIKEKYSRNLGCWDGSVHVFGDICNAMISRNMTDSLHPTKDRSLSVREVLYLMGMPNNFELPKGIGDLSKIPQNVPTCTSKSMGEQIIKYLNGELIMSDYSALKQNNENQTIEHYETGKILQRDKPVVKLNLNIPMLEEFFN